MDSADSRHHVGGEVGIVRCADPAGARGGYGLLGPERASRPGEPARYAGPRPAPRGGAPENAAGDGVLCARSDRGGVRHRSRRGREHPAGTGSGRAEHPRGRARQQPSLDALAGVVAFSRRRATYVLSAGTGIPQPTTAGAPWRCGSAHPCTHQSSVWSPSTALTGPPCLGRAIGVGQPFARWKTGRRWPFDTPLDPGRRPIAPLAPAHRARHGETR